MAVRYHNSSRVYASKKTVMLLPVPGLLVIAAYVWRMYFGMRTARADAGG